MRIPRLLRRRAKTGRPGGGLSPVKSGVLAALIVGLAVYFAFTKAIPFVHQYTIKGAFQSASTLKAGVPVRIAGVNVGKVTGIEHLRKGGAGALVTMTIDGQGRPIHTDATLKIRPRIFLEGNEFIDVQPGTPNSPELADGATVPERQTAYPVQIDQVLGALQSNTRQDLVTLLANYATALQGRGGSGYNRSIPFQKPAAQYASIVNQATLGINRHDLSGFIAASGATAQALDRNRPALRNLITDFNTTAAAFAVQQSNLQQTVIELPKTLRAANPALVALEGSFPHVDRLVTDLRPAVRTTSPTIDATEPLIAQLDGLVSRPELRGLVADLRPTIPALARLNAATVPLLRQVRPAASCQNTVVLPWTRLTLPDSHFPATGPVYQEAVRFLPGLAAESRSGDANGQWFHVLATGGTQIVQQGVVPQLQSLFPVLGEDPPKPAPGFGSSRDGRPPLRPNVPCETQQLPDLATTAARPPRQQNGSASFFKAQAATIHALRSRLGLKRYVKFLARYHLGRVPAFKAAAK